MTQKLKLGWGARRWCLLLGTALALSCSQLNLDDPPDAIAGASPRSDAAAGAIDAPIGAQGPGDGPSRPASLTTDGSPGGGGSPNDPSNCGPSARDCTRLANVRGGAPVQCQDGHCVVPTTSCAEGYGHCTLNVDDGCETNLTRAETCGACGTACSGTAGLCANVNGRFQCTNSCGAVTPEMCGTSCTNLQTDVQNCGRCGQACNLPNAQARCVAGSCAVASCNPGFDDCNANPADGCEANLSQPQTCGSCTVSCSGTTMLCANMNGRFQCGNSCAGATPDNCGTRCANLQTDAQNCGTCGHVCSLPNAQARCTAGSCAIASCNPGFDDCNANPADGCEASLSRPQTCGSCAVTCTGTTALCANMGGRFACANSCPVATPDNCVTRCANLQTDVQNCGRCNSPCNLTNAVASCAAGNCAVLSCRAGFGNCNGNPIDGCEFPLLPNDRNNCGGCGIACPADSVCTNGRCVPNCGMNGQACCGSTPRCAASLVCRGGSCVPCGGQGQPCCETNSCGPNRICYGAGGATLLDGNPQHAADGVCYTCGIENAYCCHGAVCNGFTCFVGPVRRPGDATPLVPAGQAYCHACSSGQGRVGEPCCSGFACQDLLACSAGTCAQP
jgi:hypothetical protein